MLEDWEQLLSIGDISVQIASHEMLDVVTLLSKSEPTSSSCKKPSGRAEHSSDSAEDRCKEMRIYQLR